MVTEVGSAAEPYRDDRRHMVEDQLAGRGIQDRRVLDAMSRVPRELFVPSFLQPYAHEDRPLPIGYDQTISQPYIVALMSEALGLEGREKVLEIGTGSGYQTAILAELCSEVFSIERIDELSLRAEMILQKLGHTHVHLKVGDGSLGWPEAAPFHGIIVTCGATQLPCAYRDQLKDEGRLVIPLGPRGEQVLHRFSRRGEEWIDEELTHVAFVPLISGQ